ncbi:MAG: beta-hydroxyacyl-ACP dehydratase [Planctomycetota bacterium]|nr:beta-hydroxyacyl-ACP dehydratase [Planctomycetota bacterium]MDA1213765.1 beta-hydroxyacyl-ACP dehydratase [Planctomycetota bacterium]
MRWFWIDRFAEFKSGSHAVAVKNVSLAEEHLHDHFPGYPIMPGSLMIEGMAQTGGILLGEALGFEKPVVLAKVPKMEFHGWVTPGDTIHYHVHLTDVRPEGGAVQTKAMVGENVVAEGEIVFFCLEPNNFAANGFDQSKFSFSLNLLDVMKIGKAGYPSEPS